MTTTKVPRRLRILPHCSIDGLREGKRLRAGLYELHKNMSEEEAIKLATEEFQHCVQVLSDEPEPEPLATDGDLPRETTGYRYQKEKERNAVLREWEQTHGRTHPPDEIKGQKG